MKVFFKAMPNLEITLGGMFMRMVFPLNSEVFPAVFIRITNVQSSILLTSEAMNDAYRKKVFPCEILK